MATGLPVITTDSNGASEFIVDGKDGFILKDSEDYNTLAKYFDSLKDKDKCKVMGEQAAKSVSGLTWERTMEETALLCKKVYS
jgi:glycosyltransferase involved in cell wall biosynthesis